MIHEEICTYEVAKLAKEKGFPQDVFGTCEMKSACFLEDGRFYKDGCIYPIENAYTAPTQSRLQRWLREEKGVVFGISPMQEMDCDYLGWCITIYKVDDNGYGLSWKEELYLDTYELALEDALKYALEKLV